MLELFYMFFKTPHKAYSNLFWTPSKELFYWNNFLFTIPWRSICCTWAVLFFFFFSHSYSSIYPFSFIFQKRRNVPKLVASLVRGWEICYFCYKGNGCAQLSFTHIFYPEPYSLPTPPPPKRPFPCLLIHGSFSFHPQNAWWFWCWKSGSTHTTLEMYS